MELWRETPAYDLLSRCRLCLTTVGANTAELGSLAVPMVVLLPTQQLDWGHDFLLQSKCQQPQFFKGGLMQLEDYFDFSYPDYIGIKGHRLGIHNVLNHFLSGYSPEEIAAEYPRLSLEKIYATITYYLQKRSQIDAYLLRLRREEETAYQEWRAKAAPPVANRVRAIKKQRRQEMENRL